MSTRVVPLTCPNCQAALGPEVTSVAFSCAGCQSVWTVTPQGIEAQPISWSATAGEAWWRIPASVRIRDRETYVGDAGPDPRWPTLKSFWIPAFEVDFARARQLAIKQSFSGTEPVPDAAPGLLRSCQVDADAAAKLCHVVAVTLEAARSDHLKSVDVQLDLGDPELWVL